MLALDRMCIVFLVELLNVACSGHGRPALNASAEQRQLWSGPGEG